MGQQVYVEKSQSIIKYDCARLIEAFVKTACLECRHIIVSITTNIIITGNVNFLHVGASLENFVESL